MENFNPSDKQYKNFEDLPKEQQANFAKVPGGFVRKEAKDKADKAEAAAIAMALQGTDTAKEDMLLMEVADDEKKQEVEDKFKKSMLEHLPLLGVVALDGRSPLYKKILSDPKFIEDAFVIKGKDVLEYAALEIKDDKNFMEKIIERDGMALKFASGALRRDKSFVLKAVQQNPLAIQFASAEILREVSTALGDKAPEVLGFSNAVAQAKNFEELYAAIRSTTLTEGRAYNYTSEELINIIEEVRSKRGSIRDVTRTAGLRSKVAELLDK